MSRPQRRCGVVGFRQCAAWIATGLAALSMTVWDALAMTMRGVVAIPPQAVIANEVKQSMSRPLCRRGVVGFRQCAAWIATGLAALAMTVWDVLAMTKR